ncbi:Uncharacterized protein TCM_024625 [Theobroma cacao]|uniref:Uncharacterized protein n=1 Tax=Theobroma cacao TaxID=3641 RepID=A0A061EWQ1_THECC|nr:Uncharacterized protein TCM_024625 [Theobroma cacao]
MLNGFIGSFPLFLESRVTLWVSWLVLGFVCSRLMLFGIVISMFINDFQSSLLSFFGFLEVSICVFQIWVLYFPLYAFLFSIYLVRLLEPYFYYLVLICFSFI